MKRILQKIIVFVFLSTVCSSCTWLLIGMSTSSSGAKNLKMLVNEELQDTIVFIPMSHVGTKEYYRAVRQTVDSLRSEGFVFYYEMIDADTSKPKDQLDTMIRKFRRLHDLNMYDDMSASAPNFEKQALENTGIDEQKDIWADLMLDQVIDLYEFHYGEIELTECDWNTPLRAEYLCQEKKFTSRRMATGARDEYLFDLVISSSYPKKAIMYGGTHWYWFYNKMTQAGYKLVYGKV